MELYFIVNGLPNDENDMHATYEKMIDKVELSIMIEKILDVGLCAIVCGAVYVHDTMEDTGRLYRSGMNLFREYRRDN